MGIVERSLGRTSGLRNFQQVIHVLNSDGWIKDLGGIPTLGSHLRSTFANKYLPQPRTVSLTLTTAVGVGTRTFEVEFIGTDHRGRGQKETVLVTVAGDVAVPVTGRTHGLKIFADVAELNVKTVTGIVAGDDSLAGLTFAAASTRFGLNLDIAKLGDIVAGHETSGALTAPVTIDLSGITFDVTTQSIRLPSTIAANDFVILTIRTSLD